MNTCAHHSCERPGRLKGYCKAHYQQLTRQGHTTDLRVWHHGEEDPKTILLQSKREDAAGCWIWTGSIHSTGYAFVQVGGKRHRVHRLAYESFVGPVPDGKFVDHKCRRKSCFNPGHLHVVSKKENAENRVEFVSSSTGIRGVYYCKRTGRYAASVTHWGRSYWVGRFPTLSTAEAAVKAKRAELFTNSLQDAVEDRDTRRIYRSSN